MTANAFQTKTILITGACGWLGRNLTRTVAKRSLDLELLFQLPHGMRIRCLILPSEDPSGLRALNNQIEVLRGDIRNPADCAMFCEGAQEAVLFHTAGIIHPRRVKDFYAVNVGGTENLLSAASAAGIRRAVVVSSNSPVGMNPQAPHLFDESSPYKPYMNYGRSKMQMELLVKQLEAMGKIETVIVRPPWFYGPNQPLRQVLFFSMVRTGKVPMVGSGNNLRSMVYTDNLCAGLVLAGFVEKARGETYWIADRRPYSMNEIVDTVERLLEREFKLTVAHKRVRLPDVVSEVATLADATLQWLGLYNQKIHVLSEMNKTIACSITKAEKELGYQPKIALEEGMRRSLGWCIEQGIRI
jgi:nucleoside-diphosphate-sugar epimerase